MLDLLKPGCGEKILDAGCGTGVFTFDILSSGAEVIGLDLVASHAQEGRGETQRLFF